MTIEAIGFIPAGARLESLVDSHTSEVIGQGENFEAWMTSQLSELNDQMAVSEQGLRQLLEGDTSNLHHVMMELSKAETSFQLVMQVRNKLLEGYHEVMRMQV